MSERGHSALLAISPPQKGKEANMATHVSSVASILRGTIRRSQQRFISLPHFHP
jgi:hypothetical protein